ncbi:hypothetical protein [Spiroplasma turonicum]|uniref:Uncharacterized protein n=1 Tax=Spiroplasma turonicum TaxID=216946 RepID=A0A0K1P7I1_9MOLU|nr:hypothetical protein [Spiroplasma turonicum]AKU80144.1 hypothetical protein STURON_00898 [Spiroplasma turonicum]ALX71144.1 hypothetical protein STURO_v1c08930 [Spiroplasma turonicum]
MANLVNDNIEFDDNDFEEAWSNAPKLINKDINDFKLCFICKFHMNKKNIINGDLSWNIFIINLKTISLEKNNFIAVHQNCMELRPKLDCTKLVKKIKQSAWMFDENYYK